MWLCIDSALAHLTQYKFAIKKNRTPLCISQPHAFFDFHHCLGAETTRASFVPISITPSHPPGYASRAKVAIPLETSLEIAACMQTLFAEMKEQLRANYTMHTRASAHSITILFSHCKRRTTFWYLHVHVNKMQNLHLLSSCIKQQQAPNAFHFSCISVFVSCISICARDSNANWCTYHSLWCKRRWAIAFYFVKQDHGNGESFITDAKAGGKMNTSWIANFSFMLQTSYSDILDFKLLNCWGTKVIYMEVYFFLTTIKIGIILRLILFDNVLAKAERSRLTSKKLKSDC